eukprot:NODE_5797_length_676_cov_56.606557_g5774_i0.p1 GENE.NODE_5797_length_676_cov_56.606557_g5774_i0~~NODE_5797_length_676_cov_56.606557_g5774_i0.p1  ORF type:complete len:186 (+),score=42.69 NODE_5797_length_676_cov_56.606557_g5774_i0:91-648(+)
MSSDDVMMAKRTASRMKRKQSIVQSEGAAMQQLTHEEISEFREVFNLFDANGDQLIDVTELGVAMRSLGQAPTDDEIEDMIREVDEDGSGAIDFQEFLALMSKQMNDSEIEEQMRDAFRGFDGNDNGYVTAEELQQAVYEISREKLSDAEIDDIVLECKPDANWQDNGISYEEFIEFMCNTKDYV